jgi:hypothetical protein
LKKLKTKEILEKEERLSKGKRNTYDLEEFKKFLVLKRDANLEPFYAQEVFRKMRLRQFTATKRSEEQFLNKIEATFGKRNQIVLGLGDWAIKTNHHLQHSEATMTKGLFHLLRSRFQVVSVNEYKTSQIYSKDHRVRLKNVEIKIPREDNSLKTVSLHSLLTHPEETRCIFVNRDRNASQNIFHCLQYYLDPETLRERPEAFRQLSTPLASNRIPR